MDRSGGCRLGDASLVDWGWERRHWSGNVRSTSALSWCKNTSMRSSYSSAKLCLFASLKKVDGLVAGRLLCLLLRRLLKMAHGTDKGFDSWEFRMQIVK